MGNDPTSLTKLGDLSSSIYGTGGGGSYTEQVMNDVKEALFNLNVIKRKFKWIAYLLHACLLWCKLCVIIGKKYSINVA
jgi:hypothetical protein